MARLVAPPKWSRPVVGVIALTLLLSVAVVWAAYRLLLRLAAARESEAEGRPEPELWPAGLQVGPEGLVYLFAHKFVSPVDPERISPRHRAGAPLSGETLDARRWTEFLLYAVLADHYLNKRIDLEVVESTPTFMPPLPHKPWSLHVRLLEPLPPYPLSQAIEEAFGGVRGPLDEGLALDDLLERTTKHLRRKVKLWQRAGLCEQVLQHLQRAMAHLGYLRVASGDTVLERLRNPVFETVQEAAASLESRAEGLKDRLAEFERWQSLPQSATGEDQELLPGNLDPRLASCQAAEAGQWMADCLRLSIYEAVTSLRQLEPSDEFLR
jgi:hypothetical protein